MKKNIIVLIIIVLIGFGLYYWSKGTPEEVPTDQNQATTTPTEPPVPAQAEGATVVLGKSVEGRDIVAYNFGTGDTRLLFVGGIHGGYGPGTVLLASQLMDYLKANPDVIPANVKVTVIPVLNPDGLNKVVGTSTQNFTKSDISSSQAVKVSGRFNSNDVDLNRNFDCDWQPTSKWQSKTVSGGTAAFSEPESLAIKNYVEANKPAAVVTWYSAGGGVYASNCRNGVSAETIALTKAYADASGYSANESFDFYAITGDMVNWFAKNNIPAISVLLTSHTDTEWIKNQAGILAVLKYYSK